MPRQKNIVPNIVRVRRALLSVHDKSGLVALARGLARAQVELLSTGGSAQALRRARLKVTRVEDVTGVPAMFGGRVKTLHPKIHGGLLAREPTDKRELAQHAIQPIDLLVVNLYPFAATIAAGASFAQSLEQIDIGGPAMIRAGAKNLNRVCVLTDPQDYAILLAEIKTHGGTSFALRQRLAQKAFARTSRYDSAIAAWLAGELQKNDPDFAAPSYTLGARLQQSLRYGENPHQRAEFYTTDSPAPSLANANQIQGKALSYNNILDADAAWGLVSELPRTRAACVIIKHANPSGAASAPSLREAFIRARAGDPVSAFGGIIACNRALDAPTARAIASLFCEVVIAPGANAAAKKILQKKKTLRLLLTDGMGQTSAEKNVRSVAGGLLVQDNDQAGWPKRVRCATKRAPNKAQLQDLQFAWTIVKHVKSNAIVLVKDRQLIGAGAGQMSRLDSVALALQKAGEKRAQGAVLASDAFFPFADGLELAAQAGIRAIAQPGGSVRDPEVIAAANAHNLAMLFTAQRHFRH